VIDVVVSSSLSDSSSDPAFRAAHPPYDFAAATYNGQPVIGSGNQIRTVPVGGANKIAVQFSKAVAVGDRDLTLYGLRNHVFYNFGPNQPVVPVSYDPSTHTATWNFSAILPGGIPADQYIMSVYGEVADAAGNALDGEWVNPISTLSSSTLISKFPSGNGQPGGDFRFVVTLLPGDRNQNNVISFTSDIQPVLGNVGVTGVIFTWQQGDFNGNGVVSTVGDIQPALGFVGMASWQALAIADANGDGKVNNDDYLVWYAHTGYAGGLADGDFNGDGFVDVSDFQIWQFENGLIVAI